MTIHTDYPHKETTWSDVAAVWLAAFCVLLFMATAVSVTHRAEHIASAEHSGEQIAHNGDAFQQ